MWTLEKRWVGVWEADLWEEEEGVEEEEEEEAEMAEREVPERSRITAARHLSTTQKMNIKPDKPHTYIHKWDGGRWVGVSGFTVPKRLLRRAVIR